ncbi:hypothetical protein HYPSUDRAFT_60374 [Hypholoma sublateritium FD-334 SS-4]|uniref:Uncharacterized protein n=1 Tax=Hypholoma sublateritium (strain FD-334 SS-4) TaxID=945553 RepID=A0A0D2NVG0_HYPSF|nr:hypothetical protein HYPSUDRAFT_60374 [Hypholoma sublateritium FD-334 SS-4]
MLIPGMYVSFTEYTTPVPALPNGRHIDGALRKGGMTGYYAKIAASVSSAGSNQFIVKRTTSMYFGAITKERKQAKDWETVEMGDMGCFRNRFQIDGRVAERPLHEFDKGERPIQADADGHVAERPLHALEKREKATCSGGCARYMRWRKE